MLPVPCPQVLCVQSKVLLDMFGAVTGSQAAASGSKEKVRRSSSPCAPTMPCSAAPLVTSVSAGCSARGGKPERDAQLTPPVLQVVLKEPFSGCDLSEVALFLRCAYCPTSLTPDNLIAVRNSLLGLLRLADKLDASRIMQAVAQSLGGELLHSLGSGCLRLTTTRAC